MSKESFTVDAKGRLRIPKDTLLCLTTHWNLNTSFVIFETLGINKWKQPLPDFLLIPYHDTLKDTLMPIIWSIIQSNTSPTLIEDAISLRTRKIGMDDNQRILINKTLANTKLFPILSLDEKYVKIFNEQQYEMLKSQDITLFIE